MFSLFQRPITTLFMCFGLHKYLSWKYPVQYTNFCIECGYYIVYYFSKAQLLYLKIHPHIMKSLEPVFETDFFKNFFPKSQQQDKEQIEFIKNGNVILSCEKEYANNSLISPPEDFDFILYSKPDSVDKKMFFTLPISEEEFVKTDYKFIMTEMTISNDTILLHLDCERYNYFIVDNVINNKFLMYFIKNYEPWIFEKYTLEEIQNYKLKIIDHSVSVKEVDNTQKIILNKDNYEIVEDEYADLPDLISIEDEYADLPDLISVEEEKKEDKDDRPELVPDEEYIEKFS